MDAGARCATKRRSHHRSAMHLATAPRCLLVALHFVLLGASVSPGLTPHSAPPAFSQSPPALVPRWPRLQRLQRESTCCSRQPQRALACDQDGAPSQQRPPLPCARPVPRPVGPRDNLLSPLLAAILLSSCLHAPPAVAELRSDALAPPSVVGKCSGSALACQDPFEPQRALHDASQDKEHALLSEALDLVDRNFYDRRNPKGPADSTKTHSYNGIDWSELRLDLERKRFLTRYDTHKQIAKTLGQLGDKYTRFLPARSFGDLTKYDVTGVGLLLIERDGRLVVSSPPLQGSSAAEAGIQRGDRVVAINGESVDGKTPFQGAEMLQGKTGTVAAITLRHQVASDGQLQPGAERTYGPEFTVELKRSYKDVASTVSSKMLVSPKGEKVALLRVQEFNAQTKLGIVTALQSLREKAPDRYVLDLRGNPGGVLEAALQISGVFLPPSATPGTAPVVVYVLDRNGSEEVATAPSVPRSVRISAPLTIAVDRLSASASEVLASSLQDNCRASVVSRTNSFGKGLIQGAFPLSDGSAIVLTVAEYLTPKHTVIQGRGVAPDLVPEGSLGGLPSEIESGKLDFSLLDKAVSVCEPAEPYRKMIKVPEGPTFPIRYRSE